jgi:6-phosphogluconate dehydrogenase (decarboxylating)
MGTISSCGTRHPIARPWHRGPDRSVALQWSGLEHSARYLATDCCTQRQARVFDLDDRRVEHFSECSVRIASDVADLVRDADIVLVSLPNPEATRHAVLGPAGFVAACRAGTLIVDTSTIDPTTAQEVARQATDNNVDYVEAPLSGGDEEGSGVDAARAGAATFICGGTVEAVHRARPLLSLLGRHILHVGPAGTAGSRSGIDLASVESGSLAVRMSRHLVPGHQGLGYHSCGFVGVGRGQAHADLEAGRAQNAAQRIDRR